MKRLIAFTIALCALCLVLAACGEKDSEPAKATDAASEHPIPFTAEEGELPIMGGDDSSAASGKGEEANTPTHAPAASAPTEAPAPAATSAPATAAPDEPELPPELQSFFSGEEYELPIVP